MSRKRHGKSRSGGRSKSSSVPEEVLAEGSGPHGAADPAITVDADGEGLTVAAHVGGEELLEVELESASAAPPNAHDLADIASVVEHAAAAAEHAAAEEPAKPLTKAQQKAAAKAAKAAAKAAAIEDQASAATASDPHGAVDPDEVAATDSDDRTDADAMTAASTLDADADASDDALRADAADTDADDGTDVLADAETESGAALQPTDAVLDLAEGETDEAISAELPTSAATMDPTQLKHLVEALVFASDKPMTLQRLRQLTRVSDTQRLEDALTTLADDYRDRGIVLQSVSGGYQFRTRTQFSVWVQQLIAGRPVRLSRAQLETLAIVAYRQPITRPEIDDIRGVDSSGTLKVLMDRALIRVLGKREDVGRPMLYGTTKEFLDFFSLGDLRELPTLREYSELTDESRQVISDRLGVRLDDPSSSGGSDPDDGSSSGGSNSGGSDPDDGSSGGGGSSSGGGSDDLDDVAITPDPSSSMAFSDADDATTAKGDAGAASDATDADLSAASASAVASAPDVEAVSADVDVVDDAVDAAADAGTESDSAPASDVPDDSLFAAGSGPMAAWEDRADEAAAVHAEVLAATEAEDAPVTDAALADQVLPALADDAFPDDASDPRDASD